MALMGASPGGPLPISIGAHTNTNWLVGWLMKNTTTATLLRAYLSVLLIRILNFAFRTWNINVILN